jgi:hypothetical protein
MLGRGGFVVHLSLALLASIELGAARTGTASLVVTSVVISLALAIVLYFTGHQGEAKKRIALLAAPFGAALGLLPMALHLALVHAHRSRGAAVVLASDGAVIASSAILGALLFGVYLTVLAVLGLEHQQAFTVLGHPGFKHFVRLCVHADGKVEAWTIGKDDMLAPGPPTIIDQFVWDPGAPREPRAPRDEPR